MEVSKPINGREGARYRSDIVRWGNVRMLGLGQHFPSLLETPALDEGAQVRMAVALAGRGGREGLAGGLKHPEPMGRLLSAISA